MKRSNRWLWLAPVVAAGIAGCDGLLEENPASTITPNNFYQSSTDAVTAVNAAYKGLHEYATRFAYTTMVETPTPQVVAYAEESGERGQFDAYRHNPDNDFLATVWSDLYQGVNYTNVVIDNVPGIQAMDAGLRARIVAEAKWLRALHYFNAVRLWGGVPLRVSQTKNLRDLEMPRARADEIYDLIIKDLTEIQASLPGSYPAAEFGRVTRGAAQTLLGKVYLQRAIAGKQNPFGDPTLWPSAKAGDLQKAEAELRKVVNSGQYTLLARYGDLWNESTEINSEVIFSVRNTNQSGQDLNVSNYLAPRNSGWINSWTSAGAELPFWQGYAADDKRRDVTWLPEYREVNGRHNVFDPQRYNAQWPTPSLRKYLIESTTVTANPRDLVVLRYADVLLMLAESLLEQGKAGEALPLVNQVRARAGLAPLTALTREALYRERNWELASEQHAWYDAPRFWDLFVAQVEAHADLRTTLRLSQAPRVDITVQEPKHRLMPIPQEVLDRNKQLAQNPGY